MTAASSAVASRLEGGAAAGGGNLRGTQAAESVSLFEFALILVQFAVILLALRQLDIGTSAFRRIFYLAGAGCVINHVLPLRRRLPFFLLLSVAGIVLVLGGMPIWSWSLAIALQRTLAILVVAAVLIGICSLPLGFWTRVALLLAAGGVVAGFRAALLPAMGLAAVWPVVAAMFMFRLIIYVYDLSTLKKRPSLTQALAYFFVLPNVAVTLFPVIDFKTFCASHYNARALEIYQRGVRWMSRGIVQLVAYRFIDQLLSIKPGEIGNGAELVQYILVNAFLYLKVSGQFHLIVGLLLVFGFNLPETNHRYFLASSFTDYWRRVNIYWKDFMMKVFYYPTFFRLRRRGMTLALVVATLVSFFMTWLLHLYQTWWLKGSASITATDSLFWGLLALLVLANAVWELKRGRTRKLPSSGYPVKATLGLMLRTAGTFTGICLLWSLWSASSLSAWLGLWQHADWQALRWAVVAWLVVMGATFVFEARPAAAGASGASAPATPRLRLAAAWSMVPLLVLCFAQVAAPRLESARLQPFEDALAAGDSLVASAAGRDRGYYERLDNVDGPDRELWQTYMRVPIGEGYTGENPIRPVRDFRFNEWLPGVHVWAYETDFRTNRWSMRDREFPLAKAPGTVRIALLGTSQTMGWGIAADRTFKALIEERLTREAGSAGRFELLNFAFNGLSPLGQVDVVARRVRQFAPDVVVLVTHLSDLDWANRDLHRALRENLPIDQPLLRQVVAHTRVTARTHEVLAAGRLKPYDEAVTEWAYGQIVRECNQMGAVPVAVFLPVPEDLPIREDLAARLTRLTAEAGFVNIDLSHLFDGRTRAEVRLSDAPQNLAPRRTHFNAAAHAMIADAVYRQLTTDPRIDLATRGRRPTGAGAGQDTQAAVNGGRQ